MKKLLLAALLIIGMVASTMVLSSFSEPKQEKSIDYLLLNIPHPLYEGYAYSYDHIKDEITDKLWIRVMPSTPLQALWWNADHYVHFDVYENPSYNPEQKEGSNSNNYYLSFFGKKYYFNMEI